MQPGQDRNGDNDARSLDRSMHGRTFLADARDHQWHFLCDALMLSVAIVAERLAAWSTIYLWFVKFRDEGRFEKINHALVERWFRQPQ